MTAATSSIPAVSVIIPVQDRIEYLGAALASVRNQTFTDIEVIVVDAGSLQDVSGFVNQIQLLDRRFRLLRSDQRIGSAEARNLGLQEARAAFVAHHDSDDVMLSDRLATQLKAFSEADINCVAGCMLGINADGLRVTSDNPRRRHDIGIPMSDPMIRWRFPFQMPGLSSSLIMRTQAIRDIGGFVTDHPTCDDYATMSLLIERGKVIRIAEFVTEYRNHGHQISQSRSAEQQVQLSLLRQRIIASRIGSEVPLGPVMALALPGLPAATRDRYRHEAVSLLDLLLERFLAAHAPLGRDREWILHDYAARREQLVTERDDSGGLADEIA